MEIEAAKDLSDEKLFSLCQQYGEQARKWRQKFAGLLPEVNRRKLYEKKGFGSIFEFSAKLAGMSAEQVSRVLFLEKKFTDLPQLKFLLETGEVSINKLARVASIATQENESIWANQVKLLPNRALETLVRDERKAVHVHTTENILGIWQEQELHFSPEVRQKLLELQNKGIDINELISGFLERREIEIAQEKERLASDKKSAISRYIPREIQRIVKKEHGDKCSIPNCSKASQASSDECRAKWARLMEMILKLPSMGTPF